MATKPKKLLSYQPEYEVTDTIGKGAMGEVLLCHDPYLDRAVAVKRMQLSFLQSEKMRQRFEREVLVLSYLQHPSIVEIFGFWSSSDGMLNLSMEFVNGWTLRQILDKDPQPPLWVSLALLWNTLEALSYAHAEYAHHKIGPVTHRDMKPTNIMVGFNGRLKLLDFGISRPDLPVEDQELTQEGTQVGTIAYMSPEQAQSQRITTATDIFSLGVITWEMLSGKHPFRHSNAMRTTTNIVSLQLSESGLPDTVPRYVKQIVLRMLEKDSRKRASAEELLPMMQAAMEGLPRDLSPYLGQYVLHIRKPENVPPPPNLKPKYASRPLWQIIAAGCTAGFLFGLLVGKLT